MFSKELRLGVNIDHVATLRNARGGIHPCPVEAAKIAMNAGADGITAHLREDRRHIKDDDIFRLKKEIDLPLNLEMAATEEMLAIALRVKPHACCIVPERREELTTEGGLNVIAGEDYLRAYCGQLKQAGIKVSLFIEPSTEAIEAAARIGADIVELHTGTYCNAANPTAQLARLVHAAALTETHRIECHAGHGLCYDTVAAVAAIPQMRELNIGHFLIGQALFEGLEHSIKKMHIRMQGARKDIAA